MLAPFRISGSGCHRSGAHENCIQPGPNAVLTGPAAFAGGPPPGNASIGRTQKPTAVRRGGASSRGGRPAPPCSTPRPDGTESQVSEPEDQARIPREPGSVRGSDRSLLELDRSSALELDLLCETLARLER